MVSVSAPITCLCHLICQATANSLRHDGNVVADNERSIGHAPLFEGCDCNKRHDVARAVRCRACVYVLTCNYFLIKRTLLLGTCTSLLSAGFLPVEIEAHALNNVKVPYDRE